MCTDVRPVALCNHVHTQIGFNCTLEGKTARLSGFHFKVPFQENWQCVPEFRRAVYYEQNVLFELFRCQLVDFAPKEHLVFICCPKF